MGPRGGAGGEGWLKLPDEEPHALTQAHSSIFRKPDRFAERDNSRHRWIAPRPFQILKTKRERAPPWPGSNRIHRRLSADLGLGHLGGGLLYLARRWLIQKGLRNGREQHGNSNRGSWSDGHNWKRGGLSVGEDAIG